MMCPECGLDHHAPAEDAELAEAIVASAEIAAGADAAAAETRAEMNADDNDAMTERARIDAEAAVAIAETQAEAAVAIAEAQAEADVAIAEADASALAVVDLAGGEPPTGGEDEDTGQLTDAPDLAAAGEPADVIVPPQLIEQMDGAAPARRTVTVSRFHARRARR